VVGALVVVVEAGLGVVVLARIFSGYALSPIEELFSRLGRARRLSKSCPQCRESASGDQAEQTMPTAHPGRLKIRRGIFFF